MFVLNLAYDSTFSLDLFYSNLLSDGWLVTLFAIYMYMYMSSLSYFGILFFNKNLKY